MRTLSLLILPFLLFPICGLAQRDLSFLNERKISISEKFFDGQKDRIFRDRFGREAYFRGWNFNNQAKGAPFFPFNNMIDLKEKLTAMKCQMGSNIIRWLVIWEGINPEVDVIDTNYLRTTTEAFKMAIDMGFYILIDFHGDLFAAPKWVPDGMGLKPDKCWLPGWCTLTQSLQKTAWASNYFLSSEVKTSLRNFWNNKLINTKEGKKEIRNEYVWMLKRALSYWRENLTTKEFDSIIGVDPWNEPAEGGLKEYKPPLTPAAWHEEKLWPFYRQIREEMDKIGYREKPIFAEPSTFWNVDLPLIAARGQGFLKNIPKEDYVFNAHSYDEIREGLTIVGRLLENGAYFGELDNFRKEGRYLNQVPFISEFGAWGESRIYDANRIIKATYQAMETTMPENQKVHYVDFYAPLVSGTQWVWGVGLNQNSGVYSYLDPNVVERAYPRFVQGDIISFYYNDTAKAVYNNTPLDWAALRLMRKEYFSKNRFLWLVWRSNGAKAPTEIFLPRAMKRENLLVITDNHILNGINNLPLKPTGQANEMFAMDDFSAGVIKGGTRLFIYNDADSAGKFHYALVVDGDQGGIPSPAELRDMKSLLYKKVYLKESPIFLLGRVKRDKIQKGNPYAK